MGAGGAGVIPERGLNTRPDLFVRPNCQTLMHPDVHPPPHLPPLSPTLQIASLLAIFHRFQSPLDTSNGVCHESPHHRRHFT
jgi:hypothetical protein